MKEKLIIEKLQQMPESLQQELLTYAEFLLAKHQQEPSKKDKELKFGMMKGTFKMSDDFDAPLDDFKEYM